MSRRIKKINRIKTIIIFSLLILFVYFIYYRFAYTKNERVEQYYQKNELLFNQLKEEVIKIVDMKEGLSAERDIYFKIEDNNKFIYFFDGSNNRIDGNDRTYSLQKKLNIIYIGISEGLSGNREVGFIVDFNNYIGEVLYWYNAKEIREFSDRDGFGLIKINNQWGFEGRIKK